MLVLFFFLCFLEFLFWDLAGVFMGLLLCYLFSVGTGMSGCRMVMRET